MEQQEVEVREMYRCTADANARHNRRAAAKSERAKEGTEKNNVTTKSND